MYSTDFFFPRFSICIILFCFFVFFPYITIVINLYNTSFFFFSPYITIVVNLYSIGFCVYWFFSRYNTSYFIIIFFLSYITRDDNFALTRPNPPRTDFTHPVKVAGQGRGKTFAPITGAGR
jgi:hypothetical protein